MQSKLRVVLPDPRKNVHARAFDEVNLALLAGLRRLCVDVELTRSCIQGDDRVLVVAPHLQPLNHLQGLRRDAILYNWEPMGWSHVAFMTPELTRLMSEFVIWDYSRNNLETWHQKGAARVVHVPLAYDPLLEKLPRRATAVDVDVLFYGSMNERREAVLRQLAQKGMRVRWLFGVYGEERDAWIQRSCLVLNMHVHEGQILELARLAYLWANRIPLVAEMNRETEDSLGMKDVMLTASHQNLADRVLMAVANESLRDDAAEASYEKFRGAPHMHQVIETAFIAFAEGCLR